MTIPHIWDERDYRCHLDAAIAAVGRVPDGLPPDSPVRFRAAQAITEEFNRRLVEHGIQARRA